MKWNDFQANVSKSFSCLRKEEDFCDVTLVSDDEQHIAAHKLVLSASSEFFKNILKKTTHSNPLIYLNGFSSKYLLLMMDYIYEGEIQIFQSDLDSFLETAQKLKIEGLIGGGADDTSMQNNCNDNSFEEKKGDKMFYETTQQVSEDLVVDTDASLRELSSKPKYFRKKETYEMARTSSNNVASSMEAVNEMVMKSGEVWVCKQCGQAAKTSSSIKLHAETHIEGLSFDCSYCEKTFRSRNSLRSHTNKCFSK